MPTVYAFLCLTWIKHFPLDYIYDTIEQALQQFLIYQQNFLILLRVSFHRSKESGSTILYPGSKSFDSAKLSTIWWVGFPIHQNDLFYIFYLFYSIKLNKVLALRNFLITSTFYFHIVQSNLSVHSLIGRLRFIDFLFICFV